MNNYDKYNLMQIESEISDYDIHYDNPKFMSGMFSTPLNFDTQTFNNKLDLFCPYFLDLLKQKKEPNIAEWWSGNGTFLQLAKQLNPEAKLHFINRSESNSNKLAKLVLEGYDCIFSETQVGLDIVINDAVYNVLSDEQITKLSGEIINSLNKNGLFLLIIDWNPSTLRSDFHLQWIHDMLQSEMNCIWGKYSFTSLWAKR